jgi:hypothetical protein
VQMGVRMRVQGVGSGGESPCEGRGRGGES